MRTLRIELGSFGLNELGVVLVWKRPERMSDKQLGLDIRVCHQYCQVQPPSVILSLVNATPSMCPSRHVFLRMGMLEES